MKNYLNFLYNIDGKKSLSVYQCDCGSSPKVIRHDKVVNNKIKTCGKCNLSRAKYQESFDLLDDKQLGYICGVIASDGNLTLDRKIKLAVSSCDQDWVFSFAKLVVKNENPTLRHYNRTGKGSFSTKPYVVFSASLPKLYRYCLDMGIFPNKTHNLDVKLNDKSDDFKYYFLRGVIDGDGSVIMGNGITSSRISITTASKEFKKCLETHFPLGLSYKHKVKYFNYSFQGDGLRRVLNRIPIENYMLARKNERLLILRDWARDYTPKVFNKEKRYFEYKGSLMSIKELLGLSKVDGITCQCLMYRLKHGWDVDDALSKKPHKRTL